MKIKVLKDFKDLKEEVKRVAGDEFSASKERYEEINTKLPGYIEEIVEEVVEEKEEKPRRRKSKGK